MKRIILFFLLSITLVGCQSVDESEYTTAIYYIPHADDETISMGPSILHNLAAGKEVVVVLLSKGRASKVINSVNKKLAKNNMEQLTPEEFGEARVREFRRAVAAMGVHPENVYVYDVEDGDFTLEKVVPIIQEFADIYPDSLHNAMSYKDRHSDHASSGKALRELKDNGTVSNALYHIPIQRHKKMFSSGSYTVPADLKENYLNALSVYGVWDPENGSYHIGLTSVAQRFEHAEKVMRSRWHK